MDGAVEQEYIYHFLVPMVDAQSVSNPAMSSLDLARHSERGKKTRWTKEEVGRQHQGVDRPGVRQVPKGSGEQGKMEKTGCKIVCGAPTTFAVKGLMMMMMMSRSSALDCGLYVADK